MRIVHLSSQHDSTRSSPRSVAELAKPAGRFGLHFLEMCVVMCMGGNLSVILFFAGASALGYPLDRDHPEWSALIAATILAAVMVAWMRFRRMDWAPTLEMAGSSFLAAGILIVAYRAGLVSAAALVPSVCVLACVLMFFVMLFRIPLYSSSHAHHRKAA
jgi:hypothetical protein